MKRGETKKTVVNNDVLDDRLSLSTDNHNELTDSTEQNAYSSALDMYNASKMHDRKRFLIRGVIILGVQLLLAFVLLVQINSRDIPTRIHRELEKQNFGVINLDLGTYTGETDFGYLNGEGSLRFNSGEVYSGEWKDNLLEGKADVQIPSVGSFSGDYWNSRKNGRGVFNWSDGSSYSGEWKDDCMEGSGEYRDPNGTVYSGVFASNTFKTGECTFENSSGSYVLNYKNGNIVNAVIRFSDGTYYEGECSENTLTGTGHMVFTNLDEYTGTYDNGKRNGSGVYIWISGEKYDGLWQDDEMSGTGTYTFADGKSLEGSFLHSTFVSGKYTVDNDFGHYIFTITDGIPKSVLMELKDGTTYNGEMNENGLNGRGQIQYSNGDKYEGSIVNGLKNGQGQYNWKSGATYMGAWKDDQMDGTGTYVYPPKETGYKLVGDFNNGVPNGSCQYYVSESEHYKTDWRNGRCVKVYE